LLIYFLFYSNKCCLMIFIKSFLYFSDKHLLLLSLCISAWRIFYYFIWVLENKEYIIQKYQFSIFIFWIFCSRKKRIVENVMFIKKINIRMFDRNIIKSSVLFLIFVCIWMRFLSASSIWKTSIENASSWNANVKVYTTPSAYCSYDRNMFVYAKSKAVWVLTAKKVGKGWQRFHLSRRTYESRSEENCKR